MPFSSLWTLESALAKVTVQSTIPSRGIKFSHPHSSQFALAIVIQTLRLILVMNLPFAFYAKYAHWKAIFKFYFNCFATQVCNPNQLKWYRGHHTFSSVYLLEDRFVTRPMTAVQMYASLSVCFLLVFAKPEVFFTGTSHDRTIFLDPNRHSRWSVVQLWWIQGHKLKTFVVSDFCYCCCTIKFWLLNKFVKFHNYNFNLWHSRLQKSYFLSQNLQSDCIFERLSCTQEWQPKGPKVIKLHFL